MRGARRHRSSDTAINMTPMIDVTFLLIIFFLVSSHLARQEHNVPLELPVAINSLDRGLESDVETVTINVLGDDGLRLGGADVTAAQLAGLLALRREQAGGRLQVRIRSGRDTPYSRVSPVLAACAEARCGDVVFSVYDPKP